MLNIFLIGLLVNYVDYCLGFFNWMGYFLAVIAHCVIGFRVLNWGFIFLRVIGSVLWPAGRGQEYYARTLLLW